MHVDPVTRLLKASLPQPPITTSYPDSENPARSGSRAVIGTSREQKSWFAGRSNFPVLFSPKRTGMWKFAIVGSLARLDIARSRGAGSAAKRVWERLAGSVLLWSLKDGREWSHDLAYVWCLVSLFRLQTQELEVASASLLGLLQPRGTPTPRDTRGGRLSEFNAFFLPYTNYILVIKI